MKIAVIGTGNVGIAEAADLTIKGHEVSLIKSSPYYSESYERLVRNSNRVCLKENGEYTETTIKDLSKDLCKVKDAEVIIITIQSTYYEKLVKNIAPYLHETQIVVCTCSYASSFYFLKYVKEEPIMIAEATGPFLEGRVELNDKPDEVVFRVGCRLERCPVSLFFGDNQEKTMEKLHKVCKAFTNIYSVIESALLNPNMILHTVGSIMSLSRIEYSKGNFCMYREAYARGNDATLSIMLQLDKEKQNVLKELGERPISIFDAGGFLGKDQLESFYQYAESSDRAISPTSVKSRYITEDVSQGLVLMESIAKRIGVRVPITTALIELASAALHIDFRYIGRTVDRLGIDNYIRLLHGKDK